jgi:hypothetical protein
VEEAGVPGSVNQESYFKGQIILLAKWKKYKMTNSNLQNTTQKTRLSNITLKTMADPQNPSG